MGAAAAASGHAQEIKDPRMFPPGPEQYDLSPDGKPKEAVAPQAIDSDSDIGTQTQDATEVPSNFKAIIDTYEAKLKDIQALLERHEEARKQSVKELADLKY